VCIVGPSGSGKSTILRCINGLETYESGTITVEGNPGRPRAGTIASVREQVSMVFQRFNLFPHRTALENVVEGPDLREARSARGRDGRGRALLDSVGLADKAKAYPHMLSGGQQQRVASPARSRCDRRRSSSTSRPPRWTPSS
jgi:polar amino acid transport system ATP-binding protein